MMKKYIANKAIKKNLEHLKKTTVCELDQYVES